MKKKIIIQIRKGNLPAKRLPRKAWEKLRQTTGAGIHKPKKGKGAYNRKLTKSMTEKET